MKKEGKSRQNSNRQKEKSKFNLMGCFSREKYTYFKKFLTHATFRKEIAELLEYDKIKKTCKKQMAQRLKACAISLFYGTKKKDSDFFLQEKLLRLGRQY